MNILMLNCIPSWVSYDEFFKNSISHMLIVGTVGIVVRMLALHEGDQG